ncbi:PDZ domain-containing protein [Xenorhabdus bovienii]|uniref:PDZ domain-containing protein n=1 Tax=Xenorhabdus bovienii TaxID=40576 RepID=UPI0023B21136|nr:PDZ domain-containing protein [Xenorhabdus bovienii]MDE9545381.1 PDZ domain-containing protein [Xenorhabdus bovienii]
MNKLLLPFIISITSISGCVSQGDRIKQQDIINQTIPTCASEKQCNAGWAAAREWVNQNCGMKIQHYSDSYMETYNTLGNSTNTACQVTKSPHPNGFSSINIRVSCSNFIRCVPDQYESVIEFNKYVGNYIKQFSPKMIGVMWGMSDKSGNLVQSAFESVGLYISTLVPQGIAEKGGLKEKDIVIAIDGKKITIVSDYISAMESHHAGDKATFTVIRNSKEMNISLEI